jgi:hypothetical protein
MKHFFTLFLGACFCLSYAQTSLSGIRPLDLVEAQYARSASFEEVSPFTSDLAKKNQITELDPDVVDFDLLNLDGGTLHQVLKSAPGQLTLNVPFATKNVTFKLDLVKVDVFNSENAVILASTNQPVDVGHGVHYRGVVKGDQTSVVAVSFFEGEVMGLIATDEGNLVLGKLRGSSWNGEHILYNDKEVIFEEPFECGTPDDGIGYKPGHLEFEQTKDVGDCIRLYIEVDNDIYTSKGGATGTTNFATGLMNQVITLYANENISSVVSQLLLWDVPSPYSGSTSSQMLSSFQAYRQGFNGDLAQLLSYKASGGIAAGFSGLCNPNPDNSMCFSSINSTYEVVPTYSWSVMVATHEFGHLWGSRHTHACVWNGNNTAIDGCSGSTEGTCPLPGYPSEGGTIMSYCHLQSVGINFNLGFGPQPGNVIRNSVANATCTAPCGPPSCDDGIQNGDETGVDCGGPECPACPTCDDGVQNGDELGVDCGGENCPPCPCTGQDVTLTIVLDNYPSETTWTITADGLTYASGGPYSQAGSTVVEVNCLNDGCYTFTIFDSFGDGICCGYGNGSYELRDASGNLLASGGQFGAFEATQFCLDSNCEPATNNFPTSTLTHSGTGSSSTTLDFGGVHQNVSFTISGLNAVTGGNPNNRYIEVATVTYVDENGVTQTHASYSGASASSADVSIPAAVLSVTVSLADGYDGNPPTTLSISLSSVNSCSAGDCPDSDGDGVCDANDICPGFDDNIDSDGDGIPDGCDDNNCMVQSGNFPTNPLTHQGSGSSSTTLNFGGTAHQEVSFSITGIGARVSGNPNNRFIEVVTVQYDDGNGTQTYGTFSGQNVSSAQVDIPGDVYSVTVSLSDGYNPATQSLSVNLSSVSSCIPVGGADLPAGNLQEGNMPDLEQSVKLFPNPANELLTLQVELPETADVQLRITDVNGKMIQMQQMTLDKGLLNARLDISQIPSGVYFLRIGVKDQFVTRKFVVVR